MRFKFLAVIIVIVGFLSVALLPHHESVTTLPSDAFASVQSMAVQDDWEGLSEFSPRTLHAQFRRQGETWDGHVLLYVACQVRKGGSWKECCAHETVTASVPNVVMQNVFQRLSRVPLHKGKYAAVQTRFADFPQPTLIFRSPAKTLVFRSESNTPHCVPWSVVNTGDEFTSSSDIPDTALCLLRPYLHEEEMHRLEDNLRSSQRMSGSRLAPPSYTADPVMDILQ